LPVIYPGPAVFDLPCDAAELGIFNHLFDSLVSGILVFSRDRKALI
jgi:hypothetical protein